MTDRPPPPPARRRHAAAATRVLVGGVALAATFDLAAVMAAEPPAEVGAGRVRRLVFREFAAREDPLDEREARGRARSEGRQHPPAQAEQREERAGGEDERGDPEGGPRR